MSSPASDRIRPTADDHRSKEAIRVLVVEDDEDDYVLTERMFLQMKQGVYELERAEDFDSAMETAGRSGHDVYLVDYQLGRRTGLDFLSALPRGREQPPAIILTSLRDNEVAIRALRVGAADYLVKGDVDADALERALQHALRRTGH